MNEKYLEYLFVKTANTETRQNIWNFTFYLNLEIKFSHLLNLKKN